MEDADIIALFFERSEQAITELSRKYGAAIRREAMNILGDAQDVEECANDTYLALWNSIPPLRPAFLGAYACRVTRNLSLNRCHANSAKKRNSRYDAALDELEASVPSLASVESEYAARELAASISRFLKTLPYDDRYLFLRRYWYADSVETIAKTMGRSPHAVSVRLFRVRKKLQKELTKEGLIP